MYYLTNDELKDKIKSVKKTNALYNEILRLKRLRNKHEVKDNKTRH